MICKIATYNTSLSRSKAGQLVQAIRQNDPHILAIAQIIAALDADIILLNEFDYSPNNDSIDNFIDHINQHLEPNKHYQYYFSAPVNTGVISPIDFNKDGKITLPTDGYGYGLFNGQYGMVLLSRFPIVQSASRTFQKFLWKDLKASYLPSLKSDNRYESIEYFTPVEQESLRLSSKSHWDIAVQLSDNHTLHCLCSHPTPPVFDGPERRNYHRNAAEIAFWQEYLSNDTRSKIRDDNGFLGGFSAGNNHRDSFYNVENFIILGDLNNDPERGDGDRATIQGLLNHPSIFNPAPSAKRFTSGRPYTANFNFGKIRADYVLPAKNLCCKEAGVFWPDRSDLNNALFFVNKKPVSDHYPVWVKIAIPQPVSK
jgi:endonuclease/exonuclease/phosphatase family metal-dependent hydrolase